MERVALPRENEEGLPPIALLRSVSLSTGKRPTAQGVMNSLLQKLGAGGRGDNLESIPG